MVGVNFIFLQAMKKPLSVLIFYLLFSFSIKAQITLTHNVGTTPIKTTWASCEYEEYWARTFTLSDFGISTTDQFIIRSGQVAISNSYEDAIIGIDVFIIDDQFPNSVPKHIGGGIKFAPLIGDTPEVVQVDFETPIVVPSGVRKVLIVAHQFEDIYNPDYRKVLIAGTDQDNDTSWFNGCREVYTYTPTEDLNTPVPDANFYINVTGEKLSMINTNENTALSHNVADDVIKTDMFSCNSAFQYWARKFVLDDFNIGKNEELIIDKGQVAISEARWGANIQFNIYKIDENFPTSFSESDLIGSSQVKNVPYFSKTGNEARIILVDFQTPVVIPADVERILVEVHKGIEYGDGAAFVAGTALENDSSWYRGCLGDPSGEYRTTQQLQASVGSYWTKPFNFYVTVNGRARSILPFEITNTNNCINSSNELSLTNQSEIDTVIWNFDDPNTGANNTSTTINNTHQFSSPGQYEITATVLHTDGNTYTITKEIEIFEAPTVNTSVSLKQCDNSDINGFSYFNLNEVKEKIVTNPENYTITFYEEKIDAENKSNAIIDVTKYTNEEVSIDKIWARVENSNGCFEISEVNLFVSTTQIPSTFLKSFYQCDDGSNFTDGIANFNFSSVTDDIKNLFPPNQQLIINYYKTEKDALAELNKIDNASISNYQNIDSPFTQNIYVRVDSALDNECLGLGLHITLNVEKIPIANSVVVNPQCDNDRDGLFSFDTSTIQSTILGTQSNVSVSYFDENGTQLQSPLPNPFTTASQSITARVTNINSQDLDGQCYAETEIQFTVNSVPIAHNILPQEICDEDFDGVGSFDTSSIQSTILQNQTGLIVRYFDENNIELQSPLPNPFPSHSQKIRVRIENPIYTTCFEETKIQFIVREKPSFELISEDIICITETPSLSLSIENPNGNYNYFWLNQNGDIVGNNQSLNISSGGLYSVYAESIYGCKSDIKTITVRESSIASTSIKDLVVNDDSVNKSITIKTDNIGLGDYEYSLTTENDVTVIDYQDEPLFENLQGGIYKVNIRDKNNCGTVSINVSIIQFPIFFTPNNDGRNDVWSIRGIKNTYKEGKISIYNRYGKTVNSFSINSIGWNGFYSNGKKAASNTYWFYAELIDYNGNINIQQGKIALLRN